MNLESLKNAATRTGAQTILDPATGIANKGTWNRHLSPGDECGFDVAVLDLADGDLEEADELLTAAAESPDDPRVADLWGKHISVRRHRAARTAVQKGVPFDLPDADAAQFAVPVPAEPRAAFWRLLADAFRVSWFDSCPADYYGLDISPGIMEEVARPWVVSQLGSLYDAQLGWTPADGKLMLDGGVIAITLQLAARLSQMNPAELTQLVEMWQEIASQFVAHGDVLWGIDPSRHEKPTVRIGRLLGEELAKRPADEVVTAGQLRAMIEKANVLPPAPVDHMNRKRMIAVATVLDVVYQKTGIPLGVNVAGSGTAGVKMTFPGKLTKRWAAPRRRTEAS